MFVLLHLMELALQVMLQCIHTHTHTYIYVYIHIFMHIHTHIYIQTRAWNVPTAYKVKPRAYLKLVFPKASSSPCLWAELCAASIELRAMCGLWATFVRRTLHFVRTALEETAGVQVKHARMHSNIVHAREHAQ